jgi:anti-sigma regulatory factor (Ser/Thr protein kinase)
MKNYELNIEGNLDNLDALRSHLTDYVKKVNRNVSEEWLNDLRLAATEIFVNICKHGKLADEKYTRIRIEHLKNKIKIMFYDNGIPWDPDLVNDPNFSDLEESGYGLYLVKSLTEKFSFKSGQKGPHKNVTCIEKIIEKNA